jgi:hypothetical protein
MAATPLRTDAPESAQPDAGGADSLRQLRDRLMQRPAR